MGAKNVRVVARVAIFLHHSFGGFRVFFVLMGSRARIRYGRRRRCASQEDEVGEWKRVGMISNDAFARSFGVFERRVFPPLLVVDPSPLHFFLVATRRGGRLVAKGRNKKKAKKNERCARAFCEDSRRRALEDNTSNARVDVFHARMCSFCALGVVRGCSLARRRRSRKRPKKRVVCV